MAGLWGAKNANDRQLLASLGNEILDAKPRKYWDFDQVNILRAYILL